LGVLGSTAVDGVVSLDGNIRGLVEPRFKGRLIRCLAVLATDIDIDVRDTMPHTSHE
jgi:hypothetical protein